jgi:hypothetical protein
LKRKQKSDTGNPLESAANIWNLRQYHTDQGKGSIGLPVVLCLVAHKRCGVKIVPFLLGVAGFVFFVLILERSIHLIVFSRFALRENPLLYVIYGIFMAGIFEETARFISFHILKKILKVWIAFPRIRIFFNT